MTTGLPALGSLATVEKTVRLPRPRNDSVVVMAIWPGWGLEPDVAKVNEYGCTAWFCVVRRPAVVTVMAAFMGRSTCGSIVMVVLSGWRASETGIGLPPDDTTTVLSVSDAGSRVTSARRLIDELGGMSVAPLAGETETISLRTSLMST